MGNAGTILIIDDEPDLVAYLTVLLGDHGYEVISATDGERGLELARKRAPDLVCLDISMPAPSGVRVYRELRGDEALAGIPVVMITGVPRQFEDFISRRRQVAPPDGYLSKPFDPDELLELLEKLLTPQPAAPGV
jgi:DNA-binding response OmpR family regulator